MKAGFYETDITPPLGTERPADFSKLLIERISDPLKVRAAVFTDDTRKVAIVGIDNIGCGEKFRRTVEAQLPDFSLLISASHTHSGGNLRDKFPDIDTASELVRRIVLVDSVAHDPDYYAFCLKQVVTAVKLAAENLSEADFSFGRGRVKDLIFNRRIRMKDGHVQTHPGKGNPDSVDYAGPVDDELGVVGVWKKGTDELLGCLLNFSCHACINLEGASADFPGVAINTVRGVYGQKTGMVYLNGASGDVTQIDNLSLKKDTGKPVAVKLGRAVGAEAVRILATADHGEVKTLRTISVNLPLKRNFPDSETVKAAYLKAAVNDGSAAFKIAKTIVMNEIICKVNPEPVEKLSVFQLGPLVIGSSSGEMFAQYALDFKAASPFPFTWYSQLASNQLGYVPTPDCFQKKTGGGYETATSHFLPETGTEIIQTLNSLARQLTPEPEPEPETVQPAKSAWNYNFEKK